MVVQFNKTKYEAVVILGTVLRHSVVLVQYQNGFDQNLFFFRKTLVEYDLPVGDNVG